MSMLAVSVSRTCSNIQIQSLSRFVSDPPNLSNYRNTLHLVTFSLDPKRSTNRERLLVLITMSAFIKLEDSPMFQKQIYSLEETADELKDRCQRLCKGCKKFTESLGVACNADTAFADSLEAFGAGQDDPVSVSIGGPVVSTFVNAFRELVTYKELLRSQVEHVLVGRLMNFLTVDLQYAKESRRRFDKSVHVYDQAREKFVSLKKNTRHDIVAELEEDLQNSRSAFERSRFNLVSALMNIEAKKKYEFLESISAIMDAHLRYFKLGYDLLSKIEPHIHQVLTYAQQSKESANIEQDNLAKRIQEYRTQGLQASVDMEPSASADSFHGIHVVGMNSYKDIEAIMQSTAKGKVQIIKQGYLLKRSSSLRGDWKRRFFVLNSQGTFYYHRNKGSKAMLHSTGAAEYNGGVFSRFRSRHHRALSIGEETLSCRTLDLRTSTIKMDAEDTDLRLCFRIISPLKTYTLQAEKEADRMDWVNKITGVIAILLNSVLQQPVPGTRRLGNNGSASGAYHGVSSINRNCSSEKDLKSNKPENVSAILRQIPGNDLCAECSSPEPDWASLNLGILLCIECSGIHRNLGVHISKVRSLTLDVKVWEPTILDLFGALGNAYCNSVWEGSLQDGRVDRSNTSKTSIRKPSPKGIIGYKEQYIYAKYVEKLLITRDKIASCNESYAKRIWEAVKCQNLQAIYRLIVISDVDIINTTYDDVVDVDLYHHINDVQDSESNCGKVKRKIPDPTACQRIKDANDPGNCLQGCSLLHLACHSGNAVMVELLIQFGANINLSDFHGRTPLHHCIFIRNNAFAKFLLRRGARPSMKDGGGLSALERAMEMGAITDEELFILLAET